MVYTNGYTPSIVMLFASEKQPLPASVSDSLAQLDYTQVRSAEDAQRALKSAHPEAIIIVGSSSEMDTFIQSIKTANEISPLLIQLTDTPVHTNLKDSADIILPTALADQLHVLLSAFIKQRTENNRLQRINNSLMQENERLRGELQQKASFSAEIDILRNAIVHNVAHELRTPLLQVKSAVALLSEDAGDNTTLVELAMGATTRLEAGVKNITVLNELINESFEAPSFEPVLLRDAYEAAVRNLRRSWEHKNNVERIRLHTPDILAPVLGDKHRLSIVLQLLIDNALKFSKESVDVIFRRMGDEIHIAVRDYGIGIPEDKVNKIFESFYQVDTSSTKRYGGMGIGLSIVRFILDRHKTQVAVETEVDKGSTFAFSLPVAKTN
ncbi:MAG: HAMP domain-containing histidine kinase [Anaerolineae bacterium]|nr:HAMP domain-containing histidine kinase [Anaerolineae bacterium]